MTNVEAVTMYKTTDGIIHATELAAKTHQNDINLYTVLVADLRAGCTEHEAKRFLDILADNIDDVDTWLNNVRFLLSQESK